MSGTSHQSEADRQHLNQVRAARTALDLNWFGPESAFSISLFGGLFRLERTSHGDWKVLPGPHTATPPRPCRPWFRIQMRPPEEYDAPWGKAEQAAGCLDISAEHYHVVRKEITLHWQHLSMKSGRLRLQLNPFMDSWELFPLTEGLVNEAAREIPFIAHLLQQGAWHTVEPHPANPVKRGSMMFVFVTGVWLRVSTEEGTFREVLEALPNHANLSPIVRPLDNGRYRFTPPFQSTVRQRHDSF
jgi:hypothetical protein